jgi:large subunit ribosomal protein L37Ae
MATTKKVWSTGRFGSRYGKRIRTKIINVEKQQKAKQKCPHCNRLTAKRLSSGIWNCSKCNSKFTGKAYIVGE